MARMLTFGFDETMTRSLSSARAQRWPHASIGALRHATPEAAARMLAARSARDPGVVLIDARAPTTPRLLAALGLLTSGERGAVVVLDDAPAQAPHEDGDGMVRSPLPVTEADWAALVLLCHALHCAPLIDVAV